MIDSLSITIFLLASSLNESLLTNVFALLFKRLQSSTHKDLFFETETMMNFRMLAPIFVTLLAPVSATLEFSQNVTNDIIYGSGNSNGFFTTNRQNGVEIGIRAKKAYVAVTGQYEIGNGTYGNFSTGGDMSSPSRVNRTTWNFDWSVNSDYTCASGTGCHNIDTFTYHFSVDTDPTLGTNFTVYNPVNDPVFIGTTCPFGFVPDNEFGNNLSTDDDGVSTSNCTAYNNLLATKNLMQNSVNYKFLESILPPTFSKDHKGIYDISIAAKDMTGIVAKSEIRVLVGLNLPTSAIECDDWRTYLVDTSSSNNVGIFSSKNDCIQFLTGANPSANGDPHFKTWGGQHYDFHGECDLVLLQSKEFESGKGLDIHIRTTIRRDFSYISSAVLRIGADVLEVESQGVYYFNGAANAELPSEFSGFEFLHTKPTDKQHVFEVHLGGRERVKLKTYKDFVSVVIEQGKAEHFLDSVGLMGDFTMGRMVARDKDTVLNDAIAFGQEWQVLDTEPTLFQTARFPQHPAKCTMPTQKVANSLRRRLLETSSLDELAAEKACEHWGEGKDDCVFDVLATGDIDMAVVGAY
jgi:hypothetical protein